MFTCRVLEKLSVASSLLSCTFMSCCSIYMYIVKPSFWANMSMTMMTTAKKHFNDWLHLAMLTNELNLNGHNKNNNRHQFIDVVYKAQDKIHTSTHRALKRCSIELEHVIRTEIFRAYRSRILHKSHVHCDSASSHLLSVNVWEAMLNRTCPDKWYWCLWAMPSCQPTNSVWCTL